MAQCIDRGVQGLVATDFAFVDQATPAMTMLHDTEKARFCGVYVLRQHDGSRFWLRGPAYFTDHA